MTISLQETREGGRWRWSLVGGLDKAGAAALERRAHHFARDSEANPSALHLHLSQLNAISHEGLAALLALARECHARRVELHILCGRASGLLPLLAHMGFAQVSASLREER